MGRTHRFLLIAAGLLWTAWMGLAGCGEKTASPEDVVTDGDDAGDADTGPDPLACDPRAVALPLDEIPAAGEAVAGKVEAASELIGGEPQLAQVGKAWKLANHEVAFVVQGSEAHVGYDLNGGSLLDADLQRSAGEPSNDTWGEQFSVVGYKIGSADAVGVLCDGSGGRAAVLRIEGIDTPSRVLSQIDALNPRPLNFRIVTDYILEPDSHVLRIRTTATNNSIRTWSSLAMGDLLLTGSTNTLFTPEVGFGDFLSVHPLYLATTSDPEQPLQHVAYAFASLHGPLTLPIASGGSTGGVGNTVHTLVAGDSTVYERVLTVGKDMSQASEPLREELGLPSTVVTGTVAGEDGPVDRASVTAFAGAGQPAAGQAITDATGAFRLVVPPGSYDLVAAKVGYLRGTAPTGALSEGGTVTVDVTLGAHGALTLDVRDAAGPCPSRVTLYGIDVEPPDSRVGPTLGESERRGAYRVIYDPSGGGTWPVKPGRYRAVVSRGFEFGFVEQEINVPAGGTVTLTATLEQLLDTTGWMAGDFHIHTLRSPDGRVTVCERVAEAAGEGLDIAVSTDHEGRTDYWPCIDEQALRPFLWTMVGSEVTNMGTGGHRNAYPLPYDSARLLDTWGPQYWADPEVLSAQVLNDKLNAESTGPVVQMNHPRSTDSYTNFAQFDPVSGTTLRTGEPLATGWDAMEVSNGGSFPFDDVALFTAERDADMQALADGGSRGDVPVFADYLAFLRLGRPVAAMGTSDVHGRADGTGFARSYIQFGSDAPTTLTDVIVRDAILAQKVVVSNGIFLRVTAEGIEAMGSTAVVPIGGTDVELYVQAEAIPDLDVSSLYVFANGRPLYLRRDTSGIIAEDTAAGGGMLELALLPEDALDEIVPLATEVRHHPVRDTYYHVVVHGIGGMGPLPSNEPFAYTNGIYVDVDGGGFSL